MLHGYANEETFKVSVTSVFPKGFLVCTPTKHTLKHKICVLKAKNIFQILQKHFLRPGRSFISATNDFSFAPVFKKDNTVKKA